MSKLPIQKMLTVRPETQQFNDFKVYCIESWREEHRAKQLWGPPEFKSLKTAFLRLGDSELAHQAWSNFLDCPDKWCSHHNPKHFLAHLDRWTPRDNQ